MNHRRLDQESLQNLLANAFAVQESRLGHQSLAAIVEVQRLIQGGELDLDGALRMISDRVREVANATGVSIGLLRGNQLVYRAGSGSGAVYTGRHVLASLTVSAGRASGEILRVENTETDTRIDAAICRQFGAKALLMLPIYQDGSVAGVLEVLFSEPHSFQESELRTYRVMTEFVQEVIDRTAQLERKKDMTAELAAAPLALEDSTSREEREKVVEGHGAVPVRGNEHLIQQPSAASGKPSNGARLLPQFTAWVLRPMQQAAAVFRNRRPWNMAMAAVATVLAIAFGIGYGERRSTWQAGPAPIQKPASIEHEVIPAKAIESKVTSMLPTTPVARKRVWLGENEIEYIGDDVTVRYFEAGRASHRVRSGADGIQYIGDDVTVRHFERKSSVVLPTFVRSTAQSIVR